MVVVNGWTDSALMNQLQPLSRWMRALSGWYARRRIRLEGPPEEIREPVHSTKKEPGKQKAQQPTGTFVQKRNAAGLKQELAGLNMDIRVWRSMSVVFMQSVFHAKLGGRLGLKLVYWLEERFPHYFGEKGQYPLVIIHKV